MPPHPASRRCRPGRRNPVTLCLRLCTLAGAMAVCGPASAGFAQDDVVAPGGFVSAYAGLLGGGRPNAGSDYEPVYLPGEYEVHETLFTGIGPVSRSAAYSMPPYVNASSGTVAMGALQYAARADETSNGEISGGLMSGGWADSLTFTSPGLDGQTGFLSFELAIHGQLTAGSGPAGVAFFDVEAYRNQSLLPSNIGWQVQSSQINPSVTLAVGEVRSLTLSFTFGQAFDLGVYAAARAGTSSAGSLAASPTAELLMSMNWNGITAVTDASGQPVAGYALSSASGLDWTRAVSPVPWPNTAALCVAGLGLLGWRLRGCRRP